MLAYPEARVYLEGKLGKAPWPMEKRKDSAEAKEKPLAHSDIEKS